MKIEFLERILAHSTTLDKVDQMILIEFKYYCTLYKLSYNDQLGESRHQSIINEKEFYGCKYSERYKCNEYCRTKSIPVQDSKNYSAGFIGFCTTLEGVSSAQNCFSKAVESPLSVKTN